MVLSLLLLMYLFFKLTYIHGKVDWFTIYL